MAPKYLMSFDVGGASGRCLLVEVGGGRIWVASRPWAADVAPGSGGFGFTFNPNLYWAVLAEAAGEVLSRSQVDPGQVSGLAATSMRHSLVFFDHNGRELIAIPNKDGRASDEAMLLGDELGETFLARTGHWPMAVLGAARLRWLQKNEPQLLEKAAFFLHPGEWAAYRMCGTAACDPSQAGESLLLDLAGRGWAGDLIDRLGFPRHLFPEVRQPGELLGKLRPDAARALGLPAGIPVSLSAGDTMSALLGLGALQPGDVGIVAGSTTPIQMVLDRPVVDPQGALWTGQHVLPGRWVLESNAGGMGEALEWVAKLLYPDSPRPISRLEAGAQRSRPGAGGMSSTIGAQVFNGKSMGLPVGSLTLTHMLRGSTDQQRANLSRAIWEGLAYSARANLEEIEKVSGRKLERLFLTGGMSRSAMWAQMLADVFACPLQVSETPQATALGAAICAGVGAGVFAGLVEGADRLTRNRTLEPGEVSKLAYREYYEGWNRVFEARTDADAMASGMLLEGVIGGDTETAKGGSPPRLRIFASAQLDEGGLALLRRLGDVTYQNYREAMNLLTGDSLVDALQGYDVFITEVDIVDLDALRRLPDLRVVVSCRGNAVNVDLAACSALGIPVLNTPGRNADAVADLTVAYMLMMLRKLVGADAFLRQPGGEAGDMGRMGLAYGQFLGGELWERTVGLVGLGAVGRGVARRLKGFGAHLLVYDPFVSEADAAMLDAEEVSFEDLLARSDIVSLHAAVTDETRGMIGAAQLQAMKPGALLVNTARAALIDYDALIQALRSGKPAGFATDVFPVEPPAAEDPLLALPNVIATPHVGGNTVEVASHQGRILFDDLSLLLAGSRPHNVLNPETLQDFSWSTPRHEDPEKIALVGSGGPVVSDLHVAAKKADEPLSAVAVQQPVAGPELQRKAESMDTLPILKQQTEKILLGFLELARQDGALIAFAAKNTVTQFYTLTDLGLEFFIAWREGKVQAGMGAPDWPAEVKMKLKAETYDAIMTGRINGNKAAMSGKLSFSGDVRLAMSTQKTQNDLIRLYTQARDKAGAPDFTSAALPTPSAQPVAAAGPTGPTLAARAYAAPSSSLPADDPRREMVAMVQELYAMQLITATGGNISVRIAGKPEAWITPSALFKGDLRPEMMVRISLEGQPLDPDALSPSSELLVHTEIFKARPDVEAVVHAHAPYATTLMLSKIPFMPITVDAGMIGEIPVVPFIMPGTSELAKAVARALGKGVAVFVQNHGVVVVGSNLRSAANKLEIVERNAQLLLGCYAAGKKPVTIPKEMQKTLKEMGDMVV